MEEAVGAAIRELRQRHGLTLAQVSEQAGISRGMLSKIETGQTSAGIDTLGRISRAAGCALSMRFIKILLSSSARLPYPTTKPHRFVKGPKVP